MGMFSRMSTIIQAKIHRLLDELEDPREMIDLSYEQQVELLQDVRRGVVEVATARQRLDRQVAKLRDDIVVLDQQARQAVAAGREDLARVALQRKQVTLAEIGDREQQIVSLEQERQKLTAAEQRLAQKVQAFRTQKEVIKAQYASAKAQARINEAFTGVSEEPADIGMAIERVQDKTETMRARADAVDQLVDAGVVKEIAQTDDLERELQQISIQQNVEGELRQLKSELGQGSDQKLLPPG